MATPNFVRALLDRPIAYHRSLAELTGSVAAGLLLSQAMYWSLRTKDPDGWFYKSREDWQEELGLTRREQENARLKLRCFHFWQEEIRGVPATLHFRVDLDKLTEALNGQYADVTLEQVLTLHAATLKQLSKAGYMRARKAGVAFEFVDYAEVLRFRGMTCGICGKKITRPIGHKPGYLAFDHIIAIAQGGSHTFKNLQPAHVECNARKQAGLSDSQSVYTKPPQSVYSKPTESVYTKPTSRLTRNQLAGLRKANQSAYTKPTFTKTTAETTAETTSEKKQQRRTRAPATAAASRFAETVIADYLDDTKPHNQARNSGLAHKLFLTGEDDHLIERWQKRKQDRDERKHRQQQLSSAQELQQAEEFAWNFLQLQRPPTDDERPLLADTIHLLSADPRHADVVTQLKGLQ